MLLVVGMTPKSWEYFEFSQPQTLFSHIYRDCLILPILLYPSPHSSLHSQSRVLIYLQTSSKDPKMEPTQLTSAAIVSEKSAKEPVVTALNPEQLGLKTAQHDEHPNSSYSIKNQLNRLTPLTETQNTTASAPSTRSALPPRRPSPDQALRLRSDMVAYSRGRARCSC